MDMPDVYYWVVTVWTLYQMLKEVCTQIKLRLPKFKRKRRKVKVRK